MKLASTSMIAFGPLLVGQGFSYEINPWNAMLKLRLLLGRLCGSWDPRRLLSRQHRYTTV